MESYVYDGTDASLEYVAKHYKSGVKILCPKCNSELLVALDLETANQHKVHTGIYCTKDISHVCEMIELRSRESRGNEQS
jgi:exo-beta-1,3-glucanase (GH17 family)